MHLSLFTVCRALQYACKESVLMLYCSRCLEFLILLFCCYDMWYQDFTTPVTLWRIPNAISANWIIIVYWFCQLSYNVRFALDKWRKKWMSVCNIHTAQDFEHCMEYLLCCAWLWLAHTSLQLVNTLANNDCILPSLCSSHACLLFVSAVAEPCGSRSKFLWCCSIFSHNVDCWCSS